MSKPGSTLRSKLQRDHLAVCQVVLPGEDNVPEWVQLLPLGPSITGYDGRRFTLTDPAAVVARFKAKPLDLPFDYEHATHVRAPQGLDAPACGWIKDLELRDDGIYAKVEWNDAGRSSLLSKQYRYTSPSFWHDSEGEIRELASAALTNNPNLNLPALARAESATETPVNKELLKLLGLAENATEEQVIAATKALVEGNVKAVADVKAVQAELATARAQAPSLDKFVPRSEYELAVNRANAAEKKLADDAKAAHAAAVELAINSALKAGKIAPASRDYFVSTCSTAEGLAAFNKHVEGAPVIAAPSNLDIKKPDDSNDEPEVTEQELQIASNFGFNKEQFLAAKKLLPTA